MPEFEHQEYPKQVAVKPLVDRFVAGPQPLEQIFAKISALPAPAGAQHIECEVAQRAPFAHPNAVWKTESVFFLGDDFGRENASHRFLEQISEL